MKYLPLACAAVSLCEGTKTPLFRWIEASERAAGVIATDPKMRVKVTTAVKTNLTGLFIHTLLFAINNLKTLTYASQRSAQG
jgi:hypothetical protein